jgi:hypothetical protein
MSGSRASAAGPVVGPGGLLIAVAAAFLGVTPFVVGGRLVHRNGLLGTQVLLGSVIVTAGLADYIASETGPHCRTAHGARGTAHSSAFRDFMDGGRSILHRCRIHRHRGTFRVDYSTRARSRCRLDSHSDQGCGPHLHVVRPPACGFRSDRARGLDQTGAHLHHHHIQVAVYGLSAVPVAKVLKLRQGDMTSTPGD